MSFNYAEHARLEIPEGKVRQIARKENGQVLWTKKCVNMVPLSTESGGETIFNETGYKNHVRLNSSAEVVDLNGAVTTGFFPAKAGDTISIKGIRWDQPGAGSTYFYTYDKDFNPLKSERPHVGTEDVISWVENSYVNQIPTSTDDDGNIFNGIGYKKNTRYSATSGGFVEAVGVDTTGWIPAVSGNVIYFKNIDMNKNSLDKNTVYVRYMSSTGVLSHQNLIDQNSWRTQFDDDGKLISIIVPNWDIVKVAFQAAYINMDSIITINQYPDEDIKYVNLIPLSINPDGTPYIGDNGERGFRRGYCLGANSTEVQNSNFSCTGFIPITKGHLEKFFFYNIWSPESLESQSAQNKVCLYDANFQALEGNGYMPIFQAYDIQDVYLTATGTIFTKEGLLYSTTPDSIGYWWSGLDTTKAAYIRVSSEIISEDSIITSSTPMPRLGYDYTNQIIKSTNFDNTIFNETGYMENKHLRILDGVIYERDNTQTEIPHPVFITGLIPICNGDIIRLKNCYIDCSPSNVEQVSIYGNSTDNITTIYMRDENVFSGRVWANFQSSSSIKDLVVDKNNHLTQFTYSVDNNSFLYIRLTLAPTHRPEDAIVTVNEEIPDQNIVNLKIRNYASDVKYCRFSGYGRGDNLITTVNEEITPLPSKYTYKNQVRYSTEADGITIYNGGLGYINGSRVSSGNLIKPSTGTAHTGYISVKPGDIVRIAGFNLSATGPQTAINAYNNSYAQVGQTTNQSGDYGIFKTGQYAANYNFTSIVQEKTGVWKWTVPPAPSDASNTISFIRVSAQGYGTIEYSLPILDGSLLIVTVNEEIPE